jgi:L-amino acid N-acyltransferase YncA
LAISVRKAGPDDAAGLLALSERVAADAPYFLAYDVDPASGADMLQAKLGAAANSSDCVWVAVGDGSVQGALLARAHAHPAFTGVIQLGLSVHPDHRREGLGRALMMTAITWARAQSCRRLQLAVVASNRPALALFESVGFVAEGALRDAAEIDGVRHDVIPMGLILN